MSASSQRPSAQERRLWKTPGASARWLWSVVSVLLYLALFAWYLYALKTQPFAGPLTDPLRLFGIIAYVLVLVAASYTLRRRLLRQLPGMVQNWLWMHTWLGLLSLLVVFLHENFTFVTHDYCQNLGCLTDTYWAGGALYALGLLVLIGLIGRGLDYWQTRVIAREAAMNGSGITQSVLSRLQEYEYMVERYCAGKSDPFKWACSKALRLHGRIPDDHEEIPAHEVTDWQKVSQVFNAYAQLDASLRRQRSAQRIIHTWRTVHIVVATLALLVISYHGIMELLTNVFHILAVAG